MQAQSKALRGVNKIFTIRDDLIYTLNGDPLNGTHCSISEIKLGSNGSQGKQILLSNTPISDFIITGSGTLWAIDMFGHLFCSRPLLNNIKEEGAEFVFSDENWSYCHFKVGIPALITGSDSDLIIICHDGMIIRYDGQKFTATKETFLPLKLKTIGGSHYLLRYDGVISRLVGDRWEKINLPNDTPSNIPLTGITMHNNEVIVTSSLGEIFTMEPNDTRLSILHPSKRLSWSSCASLNGELYLTAGHDGIYKMNDDFPVLIKDNSIALDSVSSSSRVFFNLGGEHSHCVAIHDPEGPKPWMLIKTS